MFQFKVPIDKTFPFNQNLLTTLICIIIPGQVFNRVKSTVNNLLYLDMIFDNIHENNRDTSRHLKTMNNGVSARSAGESLEIANL